MNCPACVITLKEVTGKLPGVVETEVSLAAQDVIVKFREKQTNPDTIREAIARAGYPARLDGMFAASGQGIGDTVIAEINGKPLFKKDLVTHLAASKQHQSNEDQASALFSVVGMRILLQAADSENLVMQPDEIEAEVQRIISEKGVPQDQFFTEMVSTYGSKEKYYQAVAQRLGIRKLIEDYVVSGSQDPDAKKRKVLDWAGKLFRQSNVIIVDREVRETLHASAGNDEWKSFWPRMIAADTDLKGLLLR
jgi:copper chaperone CopZ